MKSEKVKSPVAREGALTRMTRPFSLLDELRHELDRVWDWPWTNRGEEQGTRMTLWPRMDIVENKGRLVVKADLPGMTKENVEVVMEEGDLVLRGERAEERETSEENVYRSERTFGSFMRRIPLTFEVDPAKVEATFNEGVLTVELPMPKEMHKPKTQKILVH